MEEIRYMIQVKHMTVALMLIFILGSCQSVSEEKQENAENTKVAQTTEVSPEVKERTLIYKNLGSDNSKMVWIPAGSFKMGSDRFSDAKPVHSVNISGFWLDEHEVTNAQFALFVEATGYQTVAERNRNPKDFPNTPLDRLVPGAWVFTPAKAKLYPEEPMKWWSFLAGANWRHPEGKQSDIKNRMDHPVTHIAYEDAQAYATWAGKRLPTEAEWEYAARAGIATARYYWGDQLKPEQQWKANVYQGVFPSEDVAEDGFAGTAPVKSFSANAFGIYDMVGNLSEWCLDYYDPDYYRVAPADNPEGPAQRSEAKLQRVWRGGSFLSSDVFTEGYWTGSRGKEDEHQSRNDLGFRCVSDERPPESDSKT